MSSNNEKGQPRLSRKEQKSATRRKIKTAALQCFIEKGFVTAQIADITKDAGVAQGTFYIHFLNKETLLEELLQDFNQGFLEQINTALNQLISLDLADIVKEIVRIFLDYWEGNRDFVMIYSQKLAMGVQLENLQNGINPPMFAFLSQAIRAATLPTIADDLAIELTTHGILAMWMRIGMQSLFNEKLNREHVEETLVKLTLGALRGIFPAIKENPYQRTNKC
jgi:AcrR family transcriptional regulator